MSDNKEVTERGFRVYGRVPTNGNAIIRVQESSLAGQHAHVYLFIDNENCIQHLDRHMQPSPLLSVDQAKSLRAALATFIEEAEADMLTEPA